VADATNADRLTEVARGAQAIYNCANPPYHRWVTEWPPLATAILAAAERSGAVLVTMSNLYAYGPVDHPMTEGDLLRPAGVKGRIRASIWEDAVALHRAGRARVTEARASDYFGPGVREQGHIGARSVPAILDGRPIRVFGNPDVPHSWTYVPDIASALAILGTDERGLGRAWHVPTNPPMSQREVFGAIARLAGAQEAKLQTTPEWALRALGVFVPLLRELQEVRYQFERPFVVDSTQFATTFGVQPTPMEEGLRATIQWWLDQRRVAA